MMYRFILPSIFILFALLFVAVNVMGVGHGPSTFDFVLYFAYPACLATSLLEPYLGDVGLIWFLLCVVAASIQYFVLGYLIDKLLQRRRRVKTRTSE
jgi:phosphotransferase system  glucose/maltose/N-acetylglucosamine-specific IIC component